jgi:RimJ/RimL family protein N-acetyltransferase
MDANELTIRPWAADGLAVLLAQDSAEMTRYLGGPEGEERVRRRHEKYLLEQAEGVTWPFTVWAASAPEPVGSVVYWNMEHDGHDAYEVGWGILPAHQGHGYGARGVRLAVAHAARHGDRDRVYAFPRVDNDASNGIARSAGFRLDGETEGEYPVGVKIRVNSWSFDLRALRESAR